MNSSLLGCEKRHQRHENHVSRSIKAPSNHYNDYRVPD